LLLKRLLRGEAMKEGGEGEKILSGRLAGAM